MDSQNSTIELWRAFFLGVRATLVGNDIKLTNRAMKNAVDKLHAVANGDETIYDPNADAGFFWPHDEGRTHRMHVMFRADRELAQEIAEGFELSPDGPPRVARSCPGGRALEIMWGQISRI